MKKILALFLALILVLSITACGSKEASAEATTESTTATVVPTTEATIETTETTTENTEPVVDYDTVAILLEAGGVANWDYWKVDVMDDVFFVNFTINGIDDVVEYFKDEGYDDTYSEWVSIKETMITMFESNVNLMKTLGVENPNIYMNLVSSKDHAEVLVSIYNGDFVFDVMESDKVADQEAEEEKDITIGQTNALASAKYYLEYLTFSYDGLIGQLEYEGYTEEEATYAVDNCGADWNEQAAKSAKEFLDFSSFSRTSLIEQLEYKGFTHEQAVYGVEANGY